MWHRLFALPRDGEHEIDGQWVGSTLSLSGVTEDSVPRLIVLELARRATRIAR